MENKGPAKVCTDCYFHTDWASSGGWTGPSYKCDVCGKESWTGYAVHWNHLNAAKVDEKLALAEAIAKEGMTVARFVQAAADVIDLAVSQQGKVEVPSVLAAAQEVYDANLEAIGSHMALNVKTVTSVTLDQVIGFCKDFDHLYGSHYDPVFAGQELAEYIVGRALGKFCDPQTGTVMIGLDIDIWSDEYAHERGWD